MTHLKNLHGLLSIFLYCGILCDFSLIQVVSSHTHISPSGTPSLLDYVLLSDLKLLLYCDTIPALSTSDHLGISLALAWNPPRARVPKPWKVWLYSLGDFEKACSMTQVTDWDTTSIPAAKEMKLALVNIEY